MIKETFSNRTFTVSLSQLPVRAFRGKDLLSHNKKWIWVCWLNRLVLCSLFIGGMTSCTTASTDYSAETLLEILVERVFPEGPRGRIIYVSKQPLSGGTTIRSWRSVFIVPEKYNQAWFFFVDDAPEANWEHACRYIFIDVETGNYQVMQGMTPPKEITDMNKLLPKN
jgi:hypothetical protein